jgi:hypothetical protein
VGAVLVHIDLDGDRPHASSVMALAAGRAVASSWGATLYAALVVHEPGDKLAADSTGRVVSAKKIPGIELAQQVLSAAGADKIVVAVTDAPIAPLWASVGSAWQGVLDHLRPRLVLFGADAPSAAEIGPRTGARIGARLLLRARATGGDQVELRDRDGGYVRASDGGAAVALIGAARAMPASSDQIDLVVLASPSGADPRIELAGTSAAELLHSGGTMVAIGDDVATDTDVAYGAKRLAAVLGAHVIGGAAAGRAGVVAPGAIVERGAALAPELCIAIGTPAIDLAGATSLIRIGTAGGKGVDGALTGGIAQDLGDLVHALEES